MRKLNFHLCENKDAHQLISIFLFATQIAQSLFYLYPKFQVSGLFLRLFWPVHVGPGEKSQRPVFSRHGSVIINNQFCSPVKHLLLNLKDHLSRLVRKPTICYLSPKFQASSSFLLLYRLVCVRPGRKPRRPVFSCRGSFEQNQQPAYAKTKVQIIFAITTKLISAFVFATWIVQFLYSNY